MGPNLGVSRPGLNLPGKEGPGQTTGAFLLSNLGEGGEAMLYSTFSAADAVGVSRQTIHNYIKNGLLDATVYRYPGGRAKYQVTAAELERAFGVDLSGEDGARVLTRRPAGARAASHFTGHFIRRAIYAADEGRGALKRGECVTLEDLKKGLGMAVRCSPMNISRPAHQFIIARTELQRRTIMQGLEELERDPSAGEFLSPDWPDGPAGGMGGGLLDTLPG